MEAFYLIIESILVKNIKKFELAITPVPGIIFFALVAALFIDSWESSIYKMNVHSRSQTTIITDRQILEIAQREQPTILTFDRDYGELIFKYGIKPPAGIIYLRLEQFDSVEPAKFIDHIILSIVSKIKYQN